MADPVSHVSSVWSCATDLQIERGVGARVIDVNGTEYLDFTGGLGAASTGYAHPKITQAIADQASADHARSDERVPPRPARAARREARRRSPRLTIDTFYFGSTSDEIVEAAVKLAKHATDRRNVVVFDGAFHGRTHYTLAMSSQPGDRPGRVRAAPGRRVRRPVPRPARVRPGGRSQPCAARTRPTDDHAGGGRRRSRRS